jgi:hypothetical protein
MEKSNSIFNRGLRQVLIKLKKNKSVFSFEKIHNQLFKLKFHENGNTVRLYIGFSDHYKGALLPTEVLNKQYKNNATNFCIGYGTQFSRKDIKTIERIIKGKSCEILKGYCLEQKFLKDSKLFLLHEKENLGLISVIKTSSIQEQNGFGDFKLIFNDKEIFIDIKSSICGVVRFIEKYNHYKKTIAINYNKRKKEKFAKLLVYLLRYKYTVAV